MKRDMGLIRKILLEIEKQHVDTAVYDIAVEDHDMQEIAYHCKMLHEADLISDYGSHYADNTIQYFGVGGLTWKGHDYLEKVRNDEVWDKTIKEVEKNGLAKP